MPDTQFKILCPNGITYSWLAALLAHLDINRVKITAINHLTNTYQIRNLTTKQALAIINVFANEGYTVTAQAQKFFHVK